VKDTLATVQTVFSWAVKHDLVTENPFVGYENGNMIRTRSSVFGRLTDLFDSYLEVAMRRSAFVRMLLVMCCFSVEILHADERPAFRTDGDPDDKRPWFQLVDGEFPPEDSAHYYSGELINVDHLKRRFVLRADRTDQQNRSHFDLPSGAMMLPYGSIYYHGAPTALEDIPLGTHLHGLFYVKDPNDQTAPLEGWHNRRSYEIDFTRCLRLEDDFSFCARQNQQWRIDELNLDEHKLTATLLQDGKTIGEPATFDLQASTRVWQGKAVVTQSELAIGQLVQLNMTWATL
jgi:hypothetical protein